MFRGRGLRLLVFLLVLGGLVLPIVAGLIGTTLAAFGWLPAIGAETASLAPWQMLWSLPGMLTSVRLTLVTGLTSTLLALILAAGAMIALHGRVGAWRRGRMLAPLLAAPHAAMAIGLAFLLAPSGWIARGLTALMTGWDRPPEIASVNDPMGLALILGLLIKEVPFLLLVMGAALGQLPVRQMEMAGRALGYGRTMVWMKVILPQAYPLIRLPVFITLAYALSVVDMAIILGPSNPPVLSVAITRWFAAPDTRMILPASAAALLQAGLVAGAILLWLGAERAIGRIGPWWLARGGRGRSAGRGARLIGLLVAALMGLGLIALLSLLVWSFAWRWPWPMLLPESWTLRGWAGPGWAEALGVTAGLGLVTTFLSILLAIAWLWTQKGRGHWAGAMIYLPLLVPQIGFLYGLNVLFLAIGLPGGILAVIWAQMLFVFPYVMIALSDPWHALDPRAERTAAALGAPPLRRLLRVRLPLLSGPLLTAAAIGFGVSVAQYLPTLFMGAGRVATLTTEAVTLSSGSDRRVVGVFAFLQAGMPLVAYAAALALPAILWRNRKGMGHGS